MSFLLDIEMMCALLTHSHFSKNVLLDIDSNKFLQACALEMCQNFKSTCTVYIEFDINCILFQDLYSLYNVHFLTLLENLVNLIILIHHFLT